MATLKCSKCSAFYPASDSVCPSCQRTRGAMSPRVKYMLKYGAIFLMVFAVLFWALGGGQSKDGPAEVSDTAVIAAAISIVKANLKDPGSASFGDIARRQAAGEKDLACGTVNSKNSFGGYVGVKRFIYTHESSSVTFDDGSPDFSTAWQSLCR